MAITTPPTITALPTPPDPNDRSTFNLRAYPWSVAQQTLATQLADLADNVFDNATEAKNEATAAELAKTNAQAAVAAAEAFALEAAGHVASAASAAGAPLWVSGTSYTVGQCVWSPITHYSYRRKIAGAGTTDPSTDTTNWQKLNSGIASVKSINGTALEGTGDIVVDTIPFGAF